MIVNGGHDVIDICNSEFIIIIREIDKSELKFRPFFPDIVELIFYQSLPWCFRGNTLHLFSVSLNVETQ